MTWRRGWLTVVAVLVSTIAPACSTDKPNAGEAIVSLANQLGIDEIQLEGTRDQDSRLFANPPIRTVSEWEMPGTRDEVVEAIEAAAIELGYEVTVEVEDPYHVLVVMERSGLAVQAQVPMGQAPTHVRVTAR